MIKNIKKLFGIKPKVNIQDDVIDVWLKKINL
jgi:hypothetical protein